MTPSTAVPGSRATVGGSFAPGSRVTVGGSIGFEDAIRHANG
jgi:hypothetical protein